jgi:hypothetical protein
MHRQLAGGSLWLLTVQGSACWDSTQLARSAGRSVARGRELLIYLRLAGLRRILFRWLSLADKFVGGIAILALLLLKLPEPPSPPSTLAQMALAEGIRVAVPVAFVALLLQASARFTRAAIGAPAIWDTVHDMLDHLRDEVLGEEVRSVTTPEHAHRATLFRRRLLVWWDPRTWLKRGWLVPVERSGYTTRKTKCRWRAGDNSAETEGVAGATWINDGVLVLTHEELPDPEEDGISRDEAEKRLSEYAARTFVAMDYARERLQRSKEGGPKLARYLCGIPVRVQGKPWGVIIIDSTTETLKNAEDINRIYQLSGKAFGSLLTHDGILKRG